MGMMRVDEAMTAGQELSDRALRVFRVAAVESQFSDVTRAILEGSLA